MKKLGLKKITGEGSFEKNKLYKVEADKTITVTEDCGNIVNLKYSL